jgi:hypothetical protein
VPPRAVPPLATPLPLAKLAVALALIPVWSAWFGAVGALAMLLLFVLAIGVNLAVGRTPDCHCFGQLHSSPAGRSTLARTEPRAARFLRSRDSGSFLGSTMRLLPNDAGRSSRLGRRPSGRSARARGSFYRNRGRRPSDGSAVIGFARSEPPSRDRLRRSWNPDGHPYLMRRVDSARNLPLGLRPSSNSLERNRCAGGTCRNLMAHL